jgi:hypothetical protein
VSICVLLDRFLIRLGRSNARPIATEAGYHAPYLVERPVARRRGSRSYGALLPAIRDQPT